MLQKSELKPKPGMIYSGVSNLELRCHEPGEGLPIFCSGLEFIAHGFGVTVALDGLEQPGYHRQVRGCVLPVGSFGFAGAEPFNPS
jgi:hypothetical protein